MLPWEAKPCLLFLPLSSLDAGPMFSSLKCMVPGWLAGRDDDR